MRELIESPVMSAYSERDPPSENSFSLPPISLKLTPSPDDLEYRDDTHRASEGQSHYSSRASSFMYSRRSSRMSTSMSTSPTKFPTIDRHKSNSLASLSTARSLVKNNVYPRESLCKSPSCPQLQWDDDLSSESSSLNTNITLNGSANPSTKSRYEEPERDMKLPSISPNKGKTKRDSSLPRLDNLGQQKGSLTDREQRNGQSGKRDQLNGTDQNVLITPRLPDPGMQSNAQQSYASTGGAFLLPIRESEKANPKNYGLKGKKRNKSNSKGQDNMKGNMIKGYNGIIQVEGGAIQGGGFDIDEEEEPMDSVSADVLERIEQFSAEAGHSTDSNVLGKSQKKTNKNGRKR